MQTAAFSERGLTLVHRETVRVWKVVRTVAALPSIVVKCGGGVVLRVVVCGVVLVLSCVWCCSCCVFVCVTCFSSYRDTVLSVCLLCVCVLTQDMGTEKT